MPRYYHDSDDSSKDEAPRHRGGRKLGRGKKNGMSMIIVMGVTGSGKSFLINKLAGQSVVTEGGTLDGCTQKCTMIPADIGHTKVLLIDTPGFDDTSRTDSEILNEIARVLAGQYALGFELKGIIYVHRITDIRYTGSAVKTFEIFKRICGAEALGNVLLVTSRWDGVEDAEGGDRERQLRDKFWSYMLERGSKMARFHGDRASAVALASQLLAREPIVLKLQHEMIDNGKRLDETAAGSFVNDGLEETKKKYEAELASLEALRRELEGERDSARHGNAGTMGGGKNARMRRKVAEDLETGEEGLEAAQEQQVSLRRDVVEEVRREIQDETKNKSNRGLRTLLPLVPTALSILGLFVGVPPGCFELLAGWVMGIPDLLEGFSI